MLNKEFNVAQINAFITGYPEIFSELEPALDNCGRSSDFAFELPANLEKLPLVIDKLKEKFFVLVSSVHVNVSSEERSKFVSMKSLADKLGLSEAELRLEEIYFGDSLNDEPVFKELQKSVGVANIKTCIDQFAFLPALILEGKENNEISGVLNILKSL